jgi:hypothetical protein
MSAVPPIAPEFVHCSDLTKSANCRPEQVQQRAWPKRGALDDLVGELLKMQGHVEPECLCRNSQVKVSH